MDWRVRQLGRNWYVYSDTRGDFHRGQVGRYRPRGATVAYKSDASAQRKADELNTQLRGAGQCGVADGAAAEAAPFGGQEPVCLTDSELLYELAGALQIFARDAHERIPVLIEVARDRAAMFLRLT